MIHKNRNDEIRKELKIQNNSPSEYTQLKGERKIIGLNYVNVTQLLQCCY